MVGQSVINMQHLY